LNFEIRLLKTRYALSLSDCVKHPSKVNTNVIAKNMSDNIILTNILKLINEVRKLIINRLTLVNVSSQRYLWSDLSMSARAGLI